MEAVKRRAGGAEEVHRHLGMLGCVAWMGRWSLKYVPAVVVWLGVEGY